MSPKSFKEFVVTVSGTFPGYKQGEWPVTYIGDFAICGHLIQIGNRGSFVYLIADVKALVEGQGAIFVTTVNDQCTHLITTQKDVDKKSAKCEC